MTKLDGYWTRAWGGRKVHYVLNGKPICGAKIKSGFHYYDDRTTGSGGHPSCEKCKEKLAQMKSAATLEEEPE